MLRNRLSCAILLALASGTLLVSASASSPQILWNAFSAAPAMGHDMTPATQEVTKATSSFTITASVTDKDTFQRAVDPNDFQEQAGLENDVTIEKSFTPSATNTAFDSSTGKRTKTYIFTGPFQLGDSGNIEYRYYTSKGVDSLSLPSRKDTNTNESTSVVAFKYVPHPEPGGDGG